MTAPDPLARARDALCAALPDAGSFALQPVAAIVSPMHQAVDWACWRVPEAGLFLKLREADAMAFVDLHATAEATAASAALGLSPAVRFVLPEHGAIGLDLLPPPWRAARLHELADPATFAAALAAKRAFHAGPKLRRIWDIFAQAEMAAVAALRAGAAPDDLPVLLAGARQVQAALSASGGDLRPCHADGLSSNVMLGPGGAAMLVDFDCAGMADPHYDVGILLNEAYPFEADMHAGLDLAFGRDDPRDMNRCRLYAFIDDLFWGLWGLAMASTSLRRGLEFLKYGEWRLLRARMAHGDDAFAGRLHRL